MTRTAPRREVLLEAAAALFAERGFHAVGIDDIGAAAGISGPGVYRHFAGKQALLASLCEAALSRMQAGAREVLDGSGGEDAVRELVALHARFAVDERELIVVWAREQRALDGAARGALRTGTRAYEQLWREAVAPLRPDLSAEEVGVVVSATLAMLNFSALVAPRDVPADRRAVLLGEAARSALGC